MRTTAPPIVPFREDHIPCFLIDIAGDEALSISFEMERRTTLIMFQVKFLEVVSSTMKEC